MRLEPIGTNVTLPLIETNVTDTAPAGINSTDTNITDTGNATGTTGATDGDGGGLLLPAFP